MFARVRDVMTPGPIGVDYGQSIGETARTMRDWGIGAVLVVRDGSLYGLVTDRDLVVRALAEERGPGEPVGLLCSVNLIGVDADADVSVAARLMREHAVRRLPVLQDGQVTGIVSHGDLALPDLALPDLTGTDLTPPGLTGSGGLGAELAWAVRTFTVAAA
jgi:CBS domain-containing protein